MTVGLDRELLRSGLQALKIDVAAHEAAFVDYFNVLQQWNCVYNLTAIVNPRDIVIKHFFDSLSIQPYLRGAQIIDVGTGAGFPGIPLAIVSPERQFVLLDSQIKKIHFLQRVKSILGLSHVEIVHARIEDFIPDRTFDTVMSRAFTTVRMVQEKTAHWLSPQGHILVMKGQYPDDELCDLNNADVHGLQVPYLTQQRHVVSLSPTR